MTGLNFGVVLALVMAWGGAGYWAGDHNRNNAWLAKQAIEAKDAKKKLDDEIDRSRKAAETHLAEQQMLMKSYSTLEEKFHAVIQRPLVVYRDRPGSNVAAADVAAAQGGGSCTGESAAGVSADSDSSTVHSVGLSLGAVWVWNSALTGADSPIGGCGAADTTGQTCAADSGIGIEDAWQNHIENAKSCAVDRLRQQRLIDYIQAHEPKGETIP
ncbi:MAG: hypothetical protein FD135_2365 [Comamonadaceae bacterium]|nr:MAG: hypothetical protein FD135_2365 [Comamonadaceae bacterium]